MKSSEFLKEDGPSMREKQIQVWQALPELMNRAGIKYKVQQPLSSDTYPTLGRINIEGQAQGLNFNNHFTVSSEPKDGTAELMLNLDVETSNNLYNGQYSEQTAAAILEIAKKLAEQLNGAVKFNEYSTGKFKIPRVHATVSLPRAVASSNAPSAGPSYNPRDRFMNQPGERARQARVAGSAYSDTFGGDASNYTR